jgi:MSHA biogenesis protein MshG
MALYAYRGRGTRGELVTGTLEGADQGAVATQLMNTGVTPVDIRPTAATVGQLELPGWLASLTAPKVTLVDVMLFSRQMYTLLKAGVPILQALSGLEQSTLNRTLKQVISDLRADLEGGRELSTALRRHPKVFSPFYVSLVRVGETTGGLDQTFIQLSNYLEFEREVRERIKTALRYPMIVIGVIVIAIGIVNFAVIPVFAKLFAAQKVPLPILTRLLIGTSNVFLAYWPYMLGALIGAVVAFKLWIGTEAGRLEWDRMKLRFPISGKILLKATLTRFARAFALATRAGVPMVQALTVVANTVDNTHLARRIEQMREGVERGETILRTAVTTGVFTPVVLQMIAVGEQTGELDALMTEVADMYEREVDYDLRNLSASIEPIITIALGILVLILALGVFLPIWQIGKVMLGR